ncbi:TIGR00341 family protein [Ferruginibacter paludis]|uniref:TIGR00341 family protein n=1 Tax=Ferruginibacter paludis TaxID=1310417 RepID=UPI0025B5B587|nr:TIGR00341 family protein [Ferruginibacter paludis]MDN3656689.1 TIGR00341 family protein [Ferruginibacter paludis]
MSNFLNKFKLHAEKEHLPTVIENISTGSVFRGTNLWILIFAIFVASLGLNVNSTAVIIGAMLISPLMGPIMALGLGIGINDTALLRKAIYNFLVATGVALTTSTIFFLMSPLNEAHSEILARTAPNIYDVLIALFGGFAGIIATSSKQKGNVIPGVAIATALMPPLCTAGYGLATLQFAFFFGAFYLFIINTVFIALATFIMVRFLHFPYKAGPDEKAEKRAHRVVWIVVLITLIPSLYFGYDLVQQNRFTKKANNFINNEGHFTNDYLLNKKIDAKEKKITLVYGGKEITAAEIAALNSQLKKYDLESAELDIKQGFAYLAEKQNEPENEQSSQLTLALQIKENETKILQAKLDSIGNMRKLSSQVYAELKAQYPDLKSAVIQPSEMLTDSSGSRPTFIVLLPGNSKKMLQEKSKIENWLKVRLHRNDIQLIFKN